MQPKQSILCDKLVRSHLFNHDDKNITLQDYYLSIALDLLAVIKTKRVSTSLWSYNGTTDCYSIYTAIKQNKEGSLQNLIVEVYKAPPPLGM